MMGGREKRAGTDSGMPQRKKGKGEDEEMEEDSAKDGGNNKQHKKMTQKQMAEAMPLLLKANCFLLQGQRELEAVVMDVLLIPTSLALVAKVKEATKEWAAKVKEEGKGHKLGPPYLTVFNTMLPWLSEQDTGAKNKKEIADYVKENQELAVDDQLMFVRSCRLKRAYDPEQQKLVFALRSTAAMESLRKVLVDGFVQLGGSFKTGRAPAGGMERKLQEILNNMKE